MNDPRTPEQIEAEIVAQRQKLADTVEQMSAKLDVKSQTQAKVADLKASATTDTGAPRAELLAAAAGVAAVVVLLALLRRRRNRG